MNELFNVKVQEGRELLGLLKHGNRYYAIIHLIKKDEYVACYGYDINDGSWGQGDYCLTHEGAIKALANRLSRQKERYNHEIFIITLKGRRILYRRN